MGTGINEKFSPLLGKLLVFVFFIVFAISIVRPIIDPDLFWHLATGKWIVEHKTLPAEDPFSFTTQRYAYEEFDRTRFILRQYWLGQIIIYLCNQMAGYWGNIGFRVILFLGILFLLNRWLKEDNIDPLARVLFLVPSGMILSLFVGDRPNQMTYLFSVIMFYLLKKYRQGENRAGYLMIPVMILWSNIHGGFILGDVLLVISLSLACISYLVRTKEGKSNADIAKKGALRDVVVFSSSILASFVNPNHIKVVFTLLESRSFYKFSVFENLTPFQYMQYGQNMYVYILVLYLVILSPAILLAYRRDKKGGIFFGLTALFLTGLSTMGVRYMPFTALLLTPLVAREYGPYINRGKGVVFKAVIALIILSVFIYNARSPLLKAGRSLPPLSSNFPTNIVRFVKSEGIKGNVFNTYSIGGYLIWTLYPDVRVFIDGRGLVQRVFYAYKRIVKGDQSIIEGVPVWKALLESYKIKYALIEPTDIIGGMRDIVIRLVEDPEWRLNYIDEVSNVMLFSKDPALQEIPGILAYADILKISLLNVRNMPDNPQGYVTLAKIYTLLGKRGRAIATLEGAIRNHPAWGEGFIGQLLDYIKKNEIVRW